MEFQRDPRIYRGHAKKVYVQGVGYGILYGLMLALLLKGALKLYDTATAEAGQDTHTTRYETGVPV